jgi:hypothetical protein
MPRDSDVLCGCWPLEGGGRQAFGWFFTVALRGDLLEAGSILGGAISVSKRPCS